MAESESPRKTAAQSGSTAAHTGTTVPVGRGEGDALPHGLPLTTSAVALNGSNQDGGSPSSHTRNLLPIDEQKTVISKKPPVSEPVVLARVTTPTEMGRILVGERLGHFDLLEFVGGGGMGAVFRATDTMLNRTVAVKVLSRDQTDEETLKRFKNEAQNAARLDHEKIARVYYVGEDKGWHYIVFEYIDGVNVRDLVDDKGPLAIDEAISYTLQVTEALRHASRRDVVHRDIKPSNILVLPDGRAKLVDMGLARLHQVESPQDDLTASGVTLGTFDYISPEQARDPRNADVRSDIYSLGCTLYFTLTGRPPFPDGTVLQKLLSHSTDPPPDPRLFRPEIPDEICRILSKMLAKNPQQRYQTPDDLIAELLAVADRLGLESSARSSAVFLTPPPARTAWYEQHLPWIAPVVTLVVVIVALDWFAAPKSDAIARPKPNLLPAASSINANSGDGKKTDKRPARLNTDRETPTNNNATSSGASTTSPSTIGSEPAESVVVKKPAGEAAVTTEATPPRDTPAIDATATTEKPVTPGTESPTVTPTTPLDPAVETAPRVAPASTTPVVTRVLIVGPANTAHGPQAKVVSSLAAACAAAGNMPELEAIELHFDGQRVEQPLDITSSVITIRAAPGRTPLVVFRPDVDSVAEDRRMIRIAGGRVTIQGVQFRLEVPVERGGDGWSLIALDQIRSLEMDRCVLTVDNATDAGAPLQDDVAFLELLSPPVASRTDATESTISTIPPLVQLNGTIARGEATFIRADTGSPFQLNWDQGLLVTTTRFADIGGASDTQIWDKWVNIKLKQVTAVAREGLCVMRSRPESAKHLALEIDADNCIFVTDPSAPFLEHRTQDPIERLKTRHPDFQGHGNIFSGPREFWRIVSERIADPAEPTFVANFSTEGNAFGFQEGVLRRAVMWQAFPSTAKPPHAHLKNDYALSEEPANPALGRGFDPTALPDIFTDPKPVRPASEPTAPPSDKPIVDKPAPEKVLPEKMSPEKMLPEKMTELKTMTTPSIPASDVKPTDMRPPMMRDVPPMTPTMTTPTIPPRP